LLNYIILICIKELNKLLKLSHLKIFTAAVMFCGTPCIFVSAVMLNKGTYLTTDLIPFRYTIDNLSILCYYIISVI